MGWNCDRWLLLFLCSLSHILPKRNDFHIKVTQVLKVEHTLMATRYRVRIILRAARVAKKCVNRSAWHCRGGQTLFFYTQDIFWQKNLIGHWSHWRCSWSLLHLKNKVLKWKIMARRSSKNKNLPSLIAFHWSLFLVETHQRVRPTKKVNVNSVVCGNMGPMLTIPLRNWGPINLHNGQQITANLLQHKGC